MNIFVLDEDPYVAAEMHCDKHVCKMILESAQMLSTAHRILDGDDWCVKEILKPTHVNHPCSIWARANFNNYMWLSALLDALLEEYSVRYLKGHKYEELSDILSSAPNNIYMFPPRTPFAQCMPDAYKQSDAVQAYRDYYWYEKSTIATWKAPRTAPQWWKEYYNAANEKA